MWIYLFTQIIYIQINVSFSHFVSQKKSQMDLNEHQFISECSTSNMQNAHLLTDMRK